jgi:hypothetical protein
MEINEYNGEWERMYVRRHGDGINATIKWGSHVYYQRGRQEKNESTIEMQKIVHTGTVPFQLIRPTRDFLTFSKNRKNWEKIISEVRKKWVWRVTAELIEMVQYIKHGGLCEWTAQLVGVGAYCVCPWYSDIPTCGPHYIKFSKSFTISIPLRVGGVRTIQRPIFRFIWSYLINLHLKLKVYDYDTRNGHYVNNSSQIFFICSI